MAEESKNLTEEKSEGVTEEKHITEVRVDMSGIQTSITELQNSQKMIAETLAKLVEQKITPVISEAKEDKTKGIIAEEKKVEEKKDSNTIIEKADTGKGFQLWRDYSKENCKLKRLIR